METKEQYMVTPVMDFAETVKMVEKMKKNAEANVALANQLKANIVTLQESVQQDITSYSNKTCHHLTANQKRARAIEMAKEFVEGRKEDFLFSNLTTNKIYKGVIVKIVIEDPANFEVYICNAKFVRKENRITCLLKGVESNQVYCVGRSECRVDDVFNERIGEAIALAKALDIVEQLPPDILKAVQPTLAVGQVVKRFTHHNQCLGDEVVEKSVKFYKQENAFLINDSLVFEVGVDKIIDDTNAQYETTKGGE